MKLTNEELIIQAKSGNKEALNTLFEVNVKLTHLVANKYKNAGIEYEELLSLCNLGMMEAYILFNHNLGNKFTSLAVKCMHSEILKTIRNSRLQKNTGVVLSLETAMSDYKSKDHFLVIDALTDNKSLPNEIYELKDDLSRIKGAMDKLSDFDKQLLKKVFYDESTFQTIGNDMGISRQYATNLKNRALKRLKSLYEKEVSQ